MAAPQSIMANTSFPAIEGCQTLTHCVYIVKVCGIIYTGTKLDILNITLLAALVITSSMLIPPE